MHACYFDSPPAETFGRSQLSDGCPACCCSSSVALPVHISMRLLLPLTTVALLLQCRAAVAQKDQSIYDLNIMEEVPIERFTSRQRPARAPPATGQNDPRAIADSVFRQLGKSGADEKLTPSDVNTLGGISAKADESFKNIDTDGDGLASRAEIANLFARLTAQGWQRRDGSGADVEPPKASKPKPGAKRRKRSSPAPSAPVQVEQIEDEDDASTSHVHDHDEL